jgi:hypothetical protein
MDSVFIEWIVIVDHPDDMREPVGRMDEQVAYDEPYLIPIKKADGARAYFVHYAVMTNGQPGSWTTVTIPNVQKAVTISGLTPGVIYGFQVQALGSLGYSDWSDTTTIMCV